MQNLEILKDVIGRLERVGAAYMVTGSTAVNFYAVPRMTRDIDVVVALQPNDVQRIVELFEADYYLDGLAVSDAVARESSFNAIHFTALVKVDFIVRKSSAYRRTEFDRRRRLSFGNLEVWVVAPEDLILSKLDWARDSRSDRQLGDVRSLLHSEQSLDLHYLESWAARLGLAELLREVMA